MPDERTGDGRLLACAACRPAPGVGGGSVRLCAVGEACAQTGSWLLVRVAINNGIVARNERTLDLALAAFVAVSVAGWLSAWSLGGWSGSARGRLRAAPGTVRPPDDTVAAYFSEQRAGWIIARLTSDMDAISDVLSQGLPTIVTSCALLPAAVVALLSTTCGSGWPRWSCSHPRSSSAAGSSGPRPARSSTSASDRDRDRAHRRVGRRNDVIQTFQREWCSAPGSTSSTTPTGSPTCTHSGSSRCSSRRSSCSA